MIGFLFIIGVIFVFLLFPHFRYFVLHPVCWKGACSDIYNYFHYKRYNLCNLYGQVYMFVASGSKAFGSGKTLSMVEWLRFVYHKYNNKLVYDEDSKEFVYQHVIVISNVKLNDIPFIHFRGRDQFVNIDKLPHGKMDVIIFAIDEASTEFNSRTYKDNLPTDFLCRLLQIRKHKIMLTLTSQRFNFTDKLLRNVTGIVTTCKKIWRIVRLQDYDAFTLENAVNPEMIVPLRTRWYYANDALYHSYDTYYTVEKLKEQLESGEILKNEEILERISSDGRIENVQNKIRRSVKRRK